MFTQALWLHAFWLIEMSAAQISNFGEHLLGTQHTSTMLGKGGKPGRLWLLGVCDLRGILRRKGHYIYLTKITKLLVIQILFLVSSSVLPMC